jgi:hypothetical protein
MKLHDVQALQRKLTLFNAHLFTRHLLHYPMLAKMTKEFDPRLQKPSVCAIALFEELG